MSERRLDVAVIAAGGARDLEDLAGYLERSTGEAPDAVTLRSATERYRLIGGTAPALGATAHQAAALEKLLLQRGVPARVRHGFLASKPSLADCLGQLGDEVAVVSLDPLAPRRARARLLEEVESAEKSAGRAPRALTIIDGWGADSGLARAISRGCAEALDGSVASEWALLFVAGSQPLSEIEEGDTFVEHLQQLISQVLPSVGPGRWDLAFMGRGRGGRWLEPSPDDVAREQRKEGWNKVLVVPFGLVADDVATLIDLDLVFRQRIADLGMKYRRVRALGDSPAFIAALADLVLRQAAPEPGGVAFAHQTGEAHAASQA